MDSTRLERILQRVLTMTKEGDTIEFSSGESSIKCLMESVNRYSISFCNFENINPKWQHSIVLASQIAYEVWRQFLYKKISITISFTDEIE